MNNRQGMQVRALCMFDSQIGALVKTERKRIKKRIKRIYRMAPPKQLSKAETASCRTLRKCGRQSG